MTILCSRIKKGATPGTGKMAIWEKPDTGNPLAPFNDPLANFGLIRFHSDFQYFNNSVREDGISVSHAAVDGVTGSGYAPPEGGNGGVPGGAIANGQIVTADHALYEHDLGYVPHFMVLFDGAIVYGGTVVQMTTTKREARFVSAYATTTEIRLKDIGISSTNDLPAATLSYDVLIFRDPAPIDGAPLFRMQPAGVSLGYGRITSEQQPLRRAVGAEPFFYLPRGRTGDVRNGAYRTVSPSGALDVGSYVGTFFSADYLKVTV